MAAATSEVIGVDMLACPTCQGKGAIRNVRCKRCTGSGTIVVTFYKDGTHKEER